MILRSKGINENKVIHNMYFDGYDKVLNEILHESNDLLLLDVLDKITIMIFFFK